MVRVSIGVQGSRLLLPFPTVRWWEFEGESYYLLYFIFLSSMVGVRGRELLLSVVGIFCIHTAIKRF